MKIDLIWTVNDCPRRTSSSYCWLGSMSKRLWWKCFIMPTCLSSPLLSVGMEIFAPGIRILFQELKCGFWGRRHWMCPDYVFTSQMFIKALSILSDDAHPLNLEWRLLQAGLCLSIPWATSNTSLCACLQSSTECLEIMLVVSCIVIWIIGHTLQLWELWPDLQGGWRRSQSGPCFPLPLFDVAVWRCGHKVTSMFVVIAMPQPINQKWGMLLRWKGRHRRMWDWKTRWCTVMRSLFRFVMVKKKPNQQSFLFTAQSTFLSSAMVMNFRSWPKQDPRYKWLKGVFSAGALLPRRSSEQSLSSYLSRVCSWGGLGICIGCLLDASLGRFPTCALPGGLVWEGRKSGCSCSDSTTR